MSGRAVQIRAATGADADAVAAIYDHYVSGTVVTFEEAAVPSAVMGERIAAVVDAGLPWLVAVEGGHVAGYAYASSWNPRSAYRHTVECTAYLAPEATGRGLGTQLYEELFSRLRDLGVHAVIGVIALPNEASIALHEKFGLRRTGLFHEVGDRHLFIERRVPVDHIGEADEILAPFLCRKLLRDRKLLRIELFYIFLKLGKFRDRGPDPLSRHGLQFIKDLQVGGIRDRDRQRLFQNGDRKTHMRLGGLPRDELQNILVNNKHFETDETIAVLLAENIDELFLVTFSGFQKAIEKMRFLGALGLFLDRLPEVLGGHHPGPHEGFFQVRQ